MNTLKLREAIRVSENNISHRRAAYLSGIAPNSIRKIRKKMKLNHLTWQLVEKMDDDQLDKIFKPKRSIEIKKRQPDWDYIHNEMQKKYQTLLELWEGYRLVDPDNSYSYSQFTHHYRRHVKKLDITMRMTNYAGECIYTDWAGKLIPYTDRGSGEVRMAQVFVGVMGCSSYTFAYATPSQKKGDWIDSLNKMVDFYGGVTQTVECDNHRAYVDRAGALPVINRTSLEWGKHYNTMMLTSRVRKPQDKAAAEAGVLFVTRWITIPLRRREFFSVDEINDAIAELLPRLNERPFKRMEGCRRSRFEEMDKPLLTPLPTDPFEYAEWTTLLKVGPDYHVYVENHAYSLPYGLVGECVEARITHKMVEFYHRNKSVATHRRNAEKGAHTTNPDHRPAKHRAYANQGLEAFSTWAKSIGASVLSMVEAQFEGKPDYAMKPCRACTQLQKLGRVYGGDRLESACVRAVALRSLTVTSVRHILECGLDATDLESSIPVQQDLPLHDNVRGPGYYQNGGLSA